MSIIERSKRIVSLIEFENNVEPTKLSKVDIVCPFDEQYILRMCVCSDGKNIILPDNLRWLTPVLIESLNHQSIALNGNKQYCYITVRHGIVKSVTDDEWHVDGFSTKISHVPEQNYIWSNCIPTEYTNVSVKFPDDFNPLKHNVNNFLEQHITEEVKQCEANVVYCIDPYILHRRPLVSTGQVRTFIRISFVPIMIDDVNNTQNPKLLQSYTGDGVKFRNNLETYISK